MFVIFNKNVLFQAEKYREVEAVCSEVVDILNISRDDIYLEQNGKILYSNQHITDEGDIKVIFRLIGGKGGFGSMLRAIGAQIEKTTNREACRDLSGRRLRDINEEQRLKNWIATQTERDMETAERKKRKLEKLCQQPKHEFRDENYDKARSELPEKIEDAVLQGIEASCSKRPATDKVEKIPKKKKKLWLDDFEDLSSSDEESSNNESDNKSSEDSPSALTESEVQKNDNAKAITV
ncbi:hypothetical protein WA026_002982 [Henosepilachna vigintioctopunctata]|uniref:SDE2-like domain-containing protein n=1 Tax=Henosepilachna vigintioctopunctata TaxID=420089 RepID=A0AAW1TH07_9CUCU